MSSVESLCSAASALESEKPDLAAELLAIAKQIESFAEIPDCTLSYLRCDRADVAAISEAAELLMGLPTASDAVTAAPKLIRVGLRMGLMGEAIDVIAEQRNQLLGHIAILRG